MRGSGFVREHITATRYWVFALGFGWCACSGSVERNGVGDPTGTGATGGAQGTAGSGAGGASGSNAGGTSGSNAGGASGSNAGGTSGSGAVGGSADAGGSGGVAGGEGGTAGGSNCSSERYKAERSQLDIYVMFDDSGSMVPWWLQMTQVFTDFLNDPGSAGIGVGIQYFGADQQCAPAFYANPRVPIAPLPGNAMAIQQSFPSVPIESTPTLPALQGAISHARDWQNAHPDHKVVVLLSTDGEPASCNSTIENVSQAAAVGLAGSPSIPTYVLGMGLVLTNLHQIAQAGGTKQAFILDPNSKPALTQAMNAIRGAALPCDYVLPNGGNLDPTKVNIDFTPPGGASTRLPNVGDASRCSASGGWYYDSPQAPKRAIVCPQSCSSLNVQSGGQVDVILGCDTLVL